MSRFHRALQGAISNYLLLGVTALYSLTSVPLALYYLSKEQFALWALMASLLGYLNLVDLGMSSSISRLLIDHKDARSETGYGSLLKTGWLVLVLQGLAGLLICFASASILADVLRVQDDLRLEFIRLVQWQGITLFATFAVRIFGHVLYAHQRVDYWGYSSILILISNLLIQWGFFAAGHGVLSLIWAGLISTCGGYLFQAVVCWRLALFPARGFWGRVSRRHLGELFSYGKDIFLVSVGSQLILASQTFVITRCLGLGPAAVWAVGTKAFNMISQLVWRVYDSASPGFGEMVARGETRLLLARYRTVLVLTASFAVFCGIAYAACNASFVTVWMRGKIEWRASYDVLLAAWLLLSAISRSHNSIIMATKDLRAMGLVYFLEGGCFVLLAIAGARLAGLYGVIASSILCTLLFSFSYGVRRATALFGLSWREVAIQWMSRAWAVALRFAPLAFAAWLIARKLPPLGRLGALAGFCFITGVWCLLRQGIPEEFQKELVGKLPPLATRVLRLILPARGNPQLTSGRV